MTDAPLKSPAVEKMTQGAFVRYLPFILIAVGLFAAPPLVALGLYPGKLLDGQVGLSSTLLQLLAFQSALLVAASAVMAFLLRRASLRRIRAMADFMRRAASGEMHYDWTVAEVSRGSESDEIGDLARAVCRLQWKTRRAFDVARTNEARFRDYVDISADWIWETDASHRYATIWDGYKAVTGQAPTELLGQSRIAHFCNRADPETRTLHLAQLEARAPFRDLEIPLQTPKGLRWIRSAGVPIFGAGGELLGYRGTGTDITELKEARREAENTQNRLDNAVNAVAEGVAIFDENDILVIANETYRHFNPWLNKLGDRPVRFDEAVYAIADHVLRADTPEEERRAWIDQRMRLRDNPGTYLDVLPPEGGYARVSDYRSRDGGTVTVRTDYSDVKRRESELEDARLKAEAANRAKSEFLANISHELRTPLNAIVGYSDMLANETDTVSREQSSRYAGRILDSGRHLLELIDNLLDLSKIEAGRLTIRPSRADLAHELGAVANLMAHQLAERSQLVTGLNGMREGETFISVDRRAFRQILMNLLSNASKFSPFGTEIRIACHLDGADLRIEVADEGPGLPEEHLEKVFHRFERHASGATSAVEGTGIGLSVSRELAELHDGGLWLERRGETGLTAVLELPGSLLEGGEGVEPFCPPVPDAHPDVPADAPEVPKPHVLLAEDHPINRELMEDILRRLGCSVTVAENGAEAVDACRAERFDLVFMDIRMPVMDGLEATRRIRRIAGREDMPILAVSANAMDDHRAMSREAGMNGHIGKPATRRQIEAALKSYLPAGKQQPSPVDGALSARLAFDDRLKAVEVAVAMGRQGELADGLADIKMTLADYGAGAAARRAGRLQAFAVSGAFASVRAELPSLIREARDAVGCAICRSEDSGPACRVWDTPGEPGECPRGLPWRM